LNKKETTENAYNTVARSKIKTSSNIEWFKNYQAVIRIWARKDPLKWVEIPLKEISDISNTNDFCSTKIEKLMQRART